MQFKLLSATLTLIMVHLINANPVSIDSACVGKKTIEQTQIGADKQVTAEYYSCSESTSKAQASPALKANAAANVNVCGLQCDTTCYNGSGGPVPNDCQVIADALLYESQNTGKSFSFFDQPKIPQLSAAGNNVTVGASGPNLTNYLTLKYSTCKSTLVNQDATNITYCRNDWAGVTGYIGNNCQSTQSAKGGICVETQQQFFIQVDHS